MKNRINKAIDDFTKGRACMHVPPLDTDVDVVLGDCEVALESAKEALSDLEKLLVSCNRYNYCYDAVVRLRKSIGVD